MEHIEFVKVVTLKKEEVDVYIQSLFTDKKKDRLYIRTMIGFYIQISLASLVGFLVFYQVGSSSWEVYAVFFLIPIILFRKNRTVKVVMKDITKLFHECLIPFYDRKIAIGFMDDGIMYGKYFLDYNDVKVYYESPNKIILKHPEYRFLPIPIDHEEEYKLIERIFNKVKKDKKYICKSIIPLT